MDPVTHALVGANIAGLTGHPISISDPYFLGSTLAAMAPDLDIVLQLKGDVAYLSNHRGVSHSLPALLAISGILAGCLHLCFGAAAPLPGVFAASFLGAVSHSLLDLLNSYGVKMLWPFSRSKICWSVFGFMDWVVLLVSISALAAGTYSQTYFYAWIAALGAYFLFRVLTACRLQGRLRSVFDGDDPPQRVVMLPSAFRIATWEFLVETNRFFVVGKIDSFSAGTQIRRKLKKSKENAFIRAALDSKLGRLFAEFTPHFHVVHKIQNDRHIVRFFDLRYFTDHDFMHSGTVSFDENCCTLEEVFQPYNKERKSVL